jgi:hypothetical protein
MENKDNRRKVKKKNVYIQTMKTVNSIDTEEEIHDQEKLVNNDSRVQNKNTAIALDDKEETNYSQQLSSKNARVQTENIANSPDDEEVINYSRKVCSRKVSVQTAETAIPLDDGEDKNYPRKVRSRKVSVQAVETAIPLDDGEDTNYPRYTISKNVPDQTAEIANPFKIDPPEEVKAIELTLNGIEILNPDQVAIAVEDSDNTRDHSRTTNAQVVKSIIQEEKLITTSIINRIKANLDPIVEYANEPVLPLAEACAPLNDILHDTSFYVGMALDETPAEPPDGLTIDESAAIRLYTIEWSGGHRSLYSMLNRSLKNLDREQLRPYFKYMKLFLTALVKLPCVPPCTIWRGVTKDLSAEFPPGTPVTWWAFSSCTTELTVLENKMYLGDSGSRTLFSVEVINARTIRAHSHFVTEDELLLVPGTYMVVQSLFSPAPDLHIIHLKQEMPEEILLAPPFEGI